MEEVTLQKMTRELYHEFYRGFENDPAIFMDMSRFAPYRYEAEEVERRFEQQQTGDRIIFAVMLRGRVVGGVKLKYIDWEKKSCSLGIALQNDGVKGRGIGTKAEELALKYAFTVLGMETVNADAVRKNTRSQHVLEKVGFRYVREDETFKYYVCEREMWHERDH